MDADAVIEHAKARASLTRQMARASRSSWPPTMRAYPEFMSRIDQSGGPWACWPWTGAQSNGYGCGSVNARGHARSGAAYRLAYWLETGCWFGGVGTTVLCIRHLCHNRICCNPRHLLAGTRGDNKWDDHMRDLGVDLVAIRREIEEGPVHDFVEGPLHKIEEGVDLVRVRREVEALAPRRSSGPFLLVAGVAK